MLPTGMPTEEDFAALEATQTQTQRGLVAAALPPPAEPLQPELVNVLGQHVAKAIDHLSGGQMQHPVAPVTGPVTELPDDMAAGLVGLAEALRSAGTPRAESYAFDPNEVVTNDGVSDLIGILGRACYDDQLKAELAGAGTPGEPTGMPPR